jgi:hypothetical protein
VGTDESPVVGEGEVGGDAEAEADELERAESDPSREAVPREEAGVDQPPTDETGDDQRTREREKDHEDRPAEALRLVGQWREPRRFK